jgi:Zn finger protein HypA/HybF involved in hydrogenase expression
MRERYAPPARLPETKEAAKREAEKVRKKAEETEAEVLMRDVIALTQQEAAASVETGGPVHRRYLLRRERQEAAAAEAPRAEEVARPETVRIRAAPETAEREEFSALMQDVYAQLDATKKVETLPEQLAVKEPPKPGALGGLVPPAAPGPAPGEAPKAGSIEELLGLKPAAKPAGMPMPRVEAGGAPAALPEGTPLFAQLGEISGKPAEEKKPAVALVDVEAKKGMGCPTCHSTNAKIVFCPYCATGMCANCSPRITPTADAIVYVCPKCGEEVTIKKKRP